MRLLVVTTSLLLFTADALAGPEDLARSLPTGRLMTSAGSPEVRTIGPTGTLGPEVYRRRRKALMDKLKTGATLIINEARFDGLRGGMDFYYRVVRQVVNDAGYHDAFIHGCCHFVGLEVHDAGDYDLPLPAGAVLTIEPGIYLPRQGFGVRIEDEVLITSGGAEVLTRAVLKNPDEIEQQMQRRATPGPQPAR